MKGVIFQKPLEFNLFIDGEFWNQGTRVTGSLSVKNHGTEGVSLSDVRVHLAYGQLKKVRLKSPKAFEILASASFQASDQVGAQKEEKLTWSFDLDANCPISDSSASLFLLYGKGDALEKSGLIQLLVHPSEVIQELLKTLTTEFRFVEKTRKSNKGQVEVKLAPPQSRSFLTLEQLVLSFCFEGEAVKLSYLFQVKKVEATAAAVDIRKELKTIEQTLGPSQYRLPSGRFNHDQMTTLLRDAVSTVEAKVVF